MGIRKFAFLILLINIGYCLSSKKNVIPSISNYPNGTPCSNDTSTAWVNIILLIDVSAHMGQAKLRQLGLSLSSELSKYTIGENIDTPFASRIGIITYANRIEFAGDLYRYNDFQTVSNDLLNLKVSNQTSAVGMTDALEKATEWITDQEYANVTYREPIIIFFSASLEGVDTFLLEAYASADEARNLATVNYNQSNHNLTLELDKISAKSWNFSGNDKNLYSLLDWAITQANCFCGGAQLAAVDPHTKRFTRYADCYLLDDWFGLWDNDTFTTLCSTSYPLAINSKFKSEFIQNDDQYFNAFGYTGIYLGLHRNSQKQWVWFDYDGSEVPIGNFTQWASGYNSSSPGDCVIAKDPLNTLGKPWHWHTVSCFPVKENVCSTACGSLACSASFGMLENSQCGFGDYFMQKLEKGEKPKRNIFKNHVKNVN